MHVLHTGRLQLNGLSSLGCLEAWFQDSTPTIHSVVSYINSQPTYLCTHHFFTSSWPLSFIELTMFDFFPLPSPQWIQKIAVPLSEKINAPTLPLHLHQIIYTAALYQFTLTVISPICSGYLFGDKYKKLAPRTKFNWDVHVVSLVQSLIVTTLALYVAFNDKERAAMSWQERVYGYTGACGLVQAFATGYFVWDLWICARYIHMFGIGMLAHAVSALNVYGFGYVSFLHPPHPQSSSY